LNGQLSFEQLNIGWNAAPNDPALKVAVKGADVVIKFYLNAFAYEGFSEDDTAQITFRNCCQYRLGAPNDEGFYIYGQSRFKKYGVEWGEFYLVRGSDWQENFPNPVKLGEPNGNHNHYLFYFKDETFECIASSYEIVFSKCLPGNAQLFHLFKDRDFDKAYALELIKSIPNLNQPILDEAGHSTTYLYEAQAQNSLEAVRLLLKNGADPNFYDPRLSCDCPLWDLQYEAAEEQDNEARYAIAKLFFEHGADPNIECDGETLFDFVTFRVYNEDHGNRKYLRSFYKLLILYGGGGKEYPKPKFAEPVDLTKIDEYSVQLYLCEDGYHVQGHLADPEGRLIGDL